MTVHSVPPSLYASKQCASLDSRLSISTHTDIQLRFLCFLVQVMIIPVANNLACFRIYGIY